LSIFHQPKWLRQASAAVVQEGVDVAHKSKRFVSDFVMHHQHGRSPHHKADDDDDDHQQLHSITDHLHDSAVTVVKSNSIVPTTISSTTGKKPIVISKRDKRIAEAARTPSLNRMWSKSAVPLVPWLATFSAQTVSLLMTYLQICSALLSVGISLWRLSTLQEFDATAANVKLSLYTFYSMSCLEASIFLAERSYWYYKISWGKLLEEVKAKAGLQEEENDEQHQQQDHHSEFLVTFFYEVSVPQEEEEEEMLLQQPISHQAFFCLLCLRVLDPIPTKRSESKTNKIRVHTLHNKMCATCLQLQRLFCKLGDPILVLLEF
jgi:hypothetical protein